LCFYLKTDFKDIDVEQTNRLLFFLALFAVAGCNIRDGKVMRDLEQGEALAKKHCAECHLLPSPTDLNYRTWHAEVLPAMGVRLGFVDEQEKAHEIFRAIEPLGMYPEEKKITAEEWNQIKMYFVYNAPEELKVKEKEIPTDLGLFTEEAIETPEQFPATSLLEIDEKEQKIYYGNAKNNVLYSYDYVKKTTSEINVGGSPSDIVHYDEGMLVLSMGTIYPNDKETGFVKYFGPEKQQSLISNLPISVHLQEEDLNNDQKKDLVVCGFGYQKGKLAWYEHQDSVYQEHLLKELPGAIKTEIRDFNGDGHPDIMALMAQGDEGIFLFENDGHGNFKEDTLLRFPPGYGSTWFTFYDFNNDGKDDILYTNGDNADFGSILKPYHGIRIFYNEGNNKYTEGFFFHLNGAFRALADDYDLDGDTDIACISYFPDYNNTPQESFVYLENEGNMTFQARSSEVATKGKWLIMDKGDIDQDGDTDIVLGNSMLLLTKVPNELQKQWKEENKPIRLLLNNTMGGGL